MTYYRSSQQHCFHPALSVQGQDVLGVGNVDNLLFRIYPMMMRFTFSGNTGSTVCKSVGTRTPPRVHVTAERRYRW